jgi:hypothetical protein
VGIDPAGTFGSMTGAVRAAAAAAAPGDVVLLSPGTASFGLFRDEFERGERFREAVRALAGESSVGEVPPFDGPAASGAPAMAS